MKDFRVDGCSLRTRIPDRVPCSLRRLSTAATGVRHHELYLSFIMQALMAPPPWRGAAPARGSITCNLFIMAGGGRFPDPDEGAEFAGQRLPTDARRSLAMEAPSMGPASCERALAVAGRRVIGVGGTRALRRWKRGASTRLNFSASHWTTPPKTLHSKPKA